MRLNFSYLKPKSINVYVTKDNMPELEQKPWQNEHNSGRIRNWFTFDGDNIEYDKPLFTYSVDLEHHALNHLIRNTEPSGTLEIVTKKNEVVRLGDLLYRIHPRGFYKNENNVNKNKFLHFVNTYELSQALGIGTHNSIHRGYGISEIEFKMYWHFNDGDFIEKNNLVVTFSSGWKIDSNELNIYSLKEGYLNIIFEPLHAHRYFFEPELIFTISDSDFARVEKKYVNVPDVIRDDFKNKKIVKWRSVSGTNNYLILMNKDQDIWLGVSFEFDEIDFIVFFFAKNNFNLSKDDNVSFLFEDGTVLDFLVIHNSERSMNNGSKIFENRLPITQNELLAFKDKNLKSWKVSLKRTKKEIIGGEYGYENYLAKSNLLIAIKKFTGEYLELVSREIEEYSPLFERDNQIEKLEDSKVEICFVYLMVDRVNDIHKIGISNNPNWRERTLQSEKPTIELLVAKKFVNRKIASSFEKALHDAYASKRIRGEWFQLDASDLSEITETLKN